MHNTANTTTTVSVIMACSRVCLKLLENLTEEYHGMITIVSKGLLYITHNGEKTKIVESTVIAEEKFALTISYSHGISESITVGMDFNMTNFDQKISILKIVDNIDGYHRHIRTFNGLIAEIAAVYMNRHTSGHQGECLMITSIGNLTNNNPFTFHETIFQAICILHMGGIFTISFGDDSSTFKKYNFISVRGFVDVLKNIIQ